MGVSNVDFSFIVSYVVLIVYLLKTLKESSKDCRSFINEYEKSIEMLLSNFPKEVYFKISGTQEKGILEELRKFVESA